MPTTVRITSSQSWVVPPGVTSLAITCQSAGGNGAAPVNGQYGGGGGGGGIQHYVANVPVTPGSYVGCTLGGVGSFTLWSAGNGTYNYSVGCGGGQNAQGMLGGAAGAMILEDGFTASGSPASARTVNYGSPGNNAEGSGCSGGAGGNSPASQSSGGVGGYIGSAAGNGGVASGGGGQAAGGPGSPGTGGAGYIEITYTVVING